MTPFLYLHSYVIAKSFISLHSLVCLSKWEISDSFIRVLSYKPPKIIVNKEIMEADRRGGWPEIQKELIKIKNNLINANRTDKWESLP